MSILKIVVLVIGAVAIYYLLKQKSNPPSDTPGGGNDKTTPGGGELSLLPTGPSDQRITPSQVSFPTLEDGAGLPDPVPPPTRTPEGRVQTQRPRYMMPVSTPVSGRYAVGRYVLIERREASPLPVNVNQIIAFYNGVKIPVHAVHCEPPSGACHCVADGHRESLSHAHNPGGITRIGLDLGSDKRVDYVYVLNRDDDQGQDRIIGCVLTIRRESDGRRLFDYKFTSTATHYYIPVI